MTEDSLKANVVPFSGGGNGAKIEVYVVTGAHSFFRIPESFCKECNMFAMAAQRAAEQVDFEVDVQVKSYWTRFLRPALKGGIHPPVVLVNGKLVSQGYDVPETEELVEALESSR